MRLLSLLLVPLAIYGSGCSLPVGAEENPAAVAFASEGGLPEFIGTDAVQAAVAIRDAGLQFRLYPSSRGDEGMVINQVPKPGQQLNPGDTVDLVVGGDERVVEMIKLAAQPPALQPGDMAKNNAKELDAIRARFGDKYELSEEALAKVEVPSLEGLQHENVPPAPLPAPSPAPQVMATTAPLLGPADVPVHVESSEPAADANTQVPAGKAAPSSVTGMLAIAPDMPLTGPNTVNLEAWSVTLPGATMPVEYTVQGDVAKGVATRTGDGKTVFAVCTAKANSRGESLPAGVVDQILLAAPHRYGSPQRSGRYTSAQMPAVTSIIPTGNGPMRVVTWYGYGQLCDIGVPVDGQGRSDQVLDPILSSLRPN